VPSEGSTPIVVLVSGTGTNLQALLDAVDAGQIDARIVAVGADRGDIEGLARAERQGIATYVVRVEDFAERLDWDTALSDATAQFAPALVVSAGFMKLLGPAFLQRFTTVNTHPALLPSFPGAHAVRDALARGVKVTGCTVHVVDSGIDTGPIVAQRAVDVRPSDTEDELHARIKDVERALLVDVVAGIASGDITIPETTERAQRKVEIG
jgi:phosphoribosylglycinamide formyltransferase 1